MIRSLNVGEAAPHFTLPKSNGDVISLANCLLPNGVLVAFIHSTWCPECMRRVMSLRRTYWYVQRTNVNILLVTGQSQNSLNTFLISPESQMPFPVVSDESGEVFAQYGLDESQLHETRASFLIDRNGMIKKINKGLKFGFLMPFGL
jgi:peroxiredoxin